MSRIHILLLILFLSISSLGLKSNAQTHYTGRVIMSYFESETDPDLPSIPEKDTFKYEYGNTIAKLTLFGTQETADSFSYCVFGNDSNFVIRPDTFYFKFSTDTVMKIMKSSPLHMNEFFIIKSTSDSIIFTFRYVDVVWMRDPMTHRQYYLNRCFIGIVRIATATAGVIPHKEISTLRLLPNPAINILRIEAQIEEHDVLTTVFDQTGRTVLSKKLVFTNSEGMLDVSTLPAGVYVIILTTEKKHVSGRFVKF